MKSIKFILLLIITNIVVYYPTLSHRFLKEWDDEWQVLNRYTTNGLSLENIKEIFSTFYNGQYSPLNQFIYTTIFSVNGLSPIGFHVANLIWHIGYICLIYIFISKLLHFYDDKQELKNRWIAFFVALFMAIHPVQVEAVAWISASKILTCSFFFMSSLVCYLIYLQNFKLRYYIGTFLFFICSFFCKEQAIILPICIVLIDWFIRRKLTNKDVIIEKVPFFALSLCFLMVTMYSYNRSFIHVVANNDFYTLPQRIAFMGYSIIEYLQKLLLPVNLMYVYPYPMDTGDSLPTRFWIYPFIIPVILYIIWYFRKERVFIFSCLFFLIQLSFFLHIIPLPRFAITANRYLYIASMGFFLSLTWYLYEWLIQRKANKKIISILLIVFFSFQGFYSYNNSKEWENDKKLKAKIKLLLNERDRKSDNS